MASTFGFSAGQWNTFFSSVTVTASQQVELTPIGPLNGTFAAYRRFNDIRAMDSASGARGGAGHFLRRLRAPSY